MTALFAQCRWAVLLIVCFALTAPSTAEAGLVFGSKKASKKSNKNSTNWWQGWDDEDDDDDGWHDNSFSTNSLNWSSLLSLIESFLNGNHGDTDWSSYITSPEFLALLERFWDFKEGQKNGGGHGHNGGGNSVIPEPTSLAIWPALAGITALYLRRRRRITAQ